MNIKVILGILVVVVGGALAYVALKPEPTPQERLEEAAEQAGEAVQEAAESVSEAATEAGDAIKQQAETTTEELTAQMAETAAALAEQVNATAQETRDGLKALIADWKSSGIVTDGGIDFKKATTALEESDLSAEIKTQGKALLDFLRDAPGEASAKLKELEAAL